MASTRYYIQSTKNSAPIYLRFSDGAKFNIKRKTGFVINPAKWSKTTHYPIAKDEISKKIKSKLLALESFIIEKFNEENSLGVAFDGKWLENKINQFFNRANMDNPFETVFGIIGYIVDNAHTRKNGKGSIGLSANRIKGYDNLKVVLSKYNNNKDISIKSINREYIDRFSDWLLNIEKYKISTANKKISDLKGLCFEAERHDVTISPQIRHIKQLTERTRNKVITLNVNELNIIANTTIENKSLLNVRKWLLFGCEIGQRLDDLLNITQDNIHKSNEGHFRVLKIVQKKGNKLVEIPLSPKAEKIIENGFPYKISKPKFNKYVKVLCEKCEINEQIEHTKLDPETNRKKQGLYKKHELITGHTCRRSFASNYYGSLSNSLIMKITGHTQEKTLMTYIGKSDEDFTNLIYEQMINSLSN